MTTNLVAGNSVFSYITKDKSFWCCAVIFQLKNSTITVGCFWLFKFVLKNLHYLIKHNLNNDLTFWINIKYNSVLGNTRCNLCFLHYLLAMQRSLFYVCTQTTDNECTGNAFVLCNSLPYVFYTKSIWRFSFFAYKMLNSFVFGLLRNLPFVCNTVVCIPFFVFKFWQYFAGNFTDFPDKFCCKIFYRNKWTRFGLYA